jgi:hypothetical protein
MAHNDRGPSAWHNAGPPEALSPVHGDGACTPDANQSPHPSPLEIARSYIARGWNPVLVLFREKGPTDRGWQKRTITLDNVHRYFNTSPQNIGVQLGPKSGGLTDVDLDCKEAISLAPYFLPPTPAVFGRASKPRAHHLYTVDGAPDKAAIKYTDAEGKCIVELRIGGGEKGAQTVFPGSIHQGGEAIEWSENGEPAGSTFAALDAAVQKVAAGALFMRAWPAVGSRHDGALALGGFLARSNWSVDAIRDFVETVATEAGDDEVEDRCRAATDSASAFARGDKAYGLPKLKEIFGDKTGDKVAELFNYTDERPTEAATPVDLWAHFDPPELPTGLLPELIEKFARVQGEMTGADPAGFAMAALTTCAAAIPDFIVITPKKHDEAWDESPRLWTMLIGDPSTRKSVIIRIAARPVNAIDKMMAQQYEHERQEYEAISAEDRRTRERPKKRRIRIEDTTIEAAQEVMKDSPDGVISIQDEMGGWLGGMDRYTGNRGGLKERAFWLQAWYGGSYAYDRVGRGSAVIPNLSACLLGGIQPEPLRALAAAAVDDGLLQRCCPLVLRRATVDRDEPTDPVTSKYNDLILSLRETRPPRPDNSFVAFGSTATTLRFDDEAQGVRNELERKHERITTLEAVSKKLAAHVQKYGSIFARLCVVFHCVEHAGRDLPAVVTADTARRVAKFLHEFLLPHAVAFYAGVLGLSDDHERLSAVAGYILAHGLKRITNRDVQRGDRSMRGLTRRDTDRVFEQLDALGWISRDTSRPQGWRPSDPPRWVVNPEVHRLFQERAQVETSRRLSAREAIAEVLRS